MKEHKPFDLSEYEISREQKDLARFMIARGIHKSTQEAFAPYMFVATKKREDGKRYGNIAFPLRKPDDLTKIIGLEVRGFPNKEGKTSYKGMAAGSNSSEGLWMAIPGKDDLPKMENVKGVAWFESAYDAMAFYEIHRGAFDEYPHLAANAIFVSTGGTPTDGQMKGLLAATPKAHHFLCFDNDKGSSAQTFISWRRPKALMRIASMTSRCCHATKTGTMRCNRKPTTPATRWCRLRRKEG